MAEKLKNCRHEFLVAAALGPGEGRRGQQSVRYDDSWQLADDVTAVDATGGWRLSLEGMPEVNGVLGPDLFETLHGSDSFVSVEFDGSVAEAGGGVAGESDDFGAG